MNSKEGTVVLIKQIIDTLESLQNDAYTQPLEIFGGATLGQHFRHILDFYLCLLAGTPEGQINYANRKRNPLTETNIEAAIQQFLFIENELDQLSVEKSLKIQSDFSEEYPLDSHAFQSSVGRELMYAYDHAIHHLAIIKIGIKSKFPEIEIDPSLGVAPSTIRYKKEQGI